MRRRVPETYPRERSWSFTSTDPSSAPVPVWIRAGIPCRPRLPREGEEEWLWAGRSGAKEMRLLPLYLVVRWEGSSSLEPCDFGLRLASHEAVQFQGLPLGEGRGGGFDPHRRDCPRGCRRQRRASVTAPAPQLAPSALEQTRGLPNFPWAPFPSSAGHGGGVSSRGSPGTYCESCLRCWEWRQRWRPPGGWCHRSRSRCTRPNRPLKPARSGGGIQKSVPRKKKQETKS